jgi:hypothetical protein
LNNWKKRKGEEMKKIYRVKFKNHIVKDKPIEIEAHFLVAGIGGELYDLIHKYLIKERLFVEIGDTSKMIETVSIEKVYFTIENQ